MMSGWREYECRKCRKCERTLGVKKWYQIAWCIKSTNDCQDCRKLQSLEDKFIQDDAKRLQTKLTLQRDMNVKKLKWCKEMIADGSRTSLSNSADDPSIDDDDDRIPNEPKWFEAEEVDLRAMIKKELLDLQKVITDYKAMQQQQEVDTKGAQAQSSIQSHRESAESVANGTGQSPHHNPNSNLNSNSNRLNPPNRSTENCQDKDEKMRKDIERLMKKIEKAKLQEEAYHACSKILESEMEFYMEMFEKHQSTKQKLEMFKKIKDLRLELS